MGDACAKLLLIILSFFVPPLAVWIARSKVCSCTVCVNLLLTLLGWVTPFLGGEEADERELFVVF